MVERRIRVGLPNVKGYAVFQYIRLEIANAHEKIRAT